jgi:hypothetical protein
VNTLHLVGISKAKRIGRISVELSLQSFQKEKIGKRMLVCWFCGIVIQIRTSKH